MAQIAKLVGEQVKEILRERILSGELRPGERIALEALKEELAISATPIRDALMALERDGLVRIFPRRGVYVAEIDPQTIRDVYDVRIALESLAVENAVARIPEERLDILAGFYEDGERVWREREDLSLIVAHDADIHDLLVEYAGNRVVQELTGTLHQRIWWVRRVAGERAKRYERSFAEHKLILHALYERDSAQTTSLVREHLQAARDLTLACIQDSPSRSFTQ